MRVAVAILVAAAGCLLASPAVAAGFLPDPSDPAAPYQPWIYPAQLPGGGFEEGDSRAGPAAAAAFLTLPFAEPRYVTSIFDHCRPDYSYDGRICRFDGTVGTPSKGVDPKFLGGYSATTGMPDYMYYEGHDGMDYGLYYENVLAAADGVVTYAGWDKPGCATCGYGQNIWIDHGNGFLTRYAHLSRIGVSTGRHVTRGQVIATSGNTGASTGAHVHFGVYVARDRTAIDPYGWQAPGADPWQKDAGNLWLGGAPRYPGLPRPTVTATAATNPDDPTDVQVSWDGAGGPAEFTVSAVVDDEPAASWIVTRSGGQAHLRGVRGHSYWFWVTELTDLGWSAAARTPTVTISMHGAQP